MASKDSFHLSTEEASLKRNIIRSIGCWFRTMCFFQNPLFLPFMLLIAISPFVAWFIYRTVARFILKRVWTKWYVRRAIDASFVGLIVLYSISFWNGWGNHYSDAQRLTGKTIRSLTDIAYQTHSPLHPASEKLWGQYWDLSFLLDCQWFVNNFGNYVVLPPCVIVAIGYTIERNKQEKLMKSKTRTS